MRTRSLRIEVTPSPVSYTWTGRPVAQASASIETLSPVTMMRSAMARKPKYGLSVAPGVHQ